MGRLVLCAQKNSKTEEACTEEQELREVQLWLLNHKTHKEQESCSMGLVSRGGWFCACCARRGWSETILDGGKESEQRLGSSPVGFRRVVCPDVTKVIVQTSADP